MDLPDFLTRTDYDEIRLTGHRIGLLHVVRLFRDGWSAEMIACEFPTLPLALVYKVIGFYLDNQAEVDEYVTQVEAELDRLSTAGPHLDVAKLRARMEAIRRAQGSPGG